MIAQPNLLHHSRLPLQAGRPLADQIMGYQGPAEVLLCLDRDQNLLAASFRGSYDNEPYTRYVREEENFGSLMMPDSQT